MKSDWQSSTRAVLDQNGNVLARMDYEPFGQEIQAGIGLRSVSQGFGSQQALSQRYSQTTRDEATGLDDTWFRKLENQAGRWTSPDPYNGSMTTSNPQSFNRYSYVENDPINRSDPTGLCFRLGWSEWDDGSITIDWTDFSGCSRNSGSRSGGGGGGSGGGVGGSVGIGNPGTRSAGTGGGGGTGNPPGSRKKGCSVSAVGQLKKIGSCMAKCMNDARVDKLAKSVGDATGIPYAGDVLQGLTVTSTGAALVNQGLNLKYGRKPKWAKKAPNARKATSWQHRAFGKPGLRGMVERQFGGQHRYLSNFGKAAGRISFAVSAGVLVFEGAYTQGTFLSCSAICGWKTRPCQ